MINRKQQFAEVRQIPLQQYLESRLGLQVSHQLGNDIWYFSPFSPAQKTASFHIDTNKNKWFDFSLSSTDKENGGDLTDLIAQLHECSLYEALDIILGESPMNQPSFSFHGSQLPKNVEKFTRIIVKPLQNTALLNYLKNRKIAVGIAQIYLNEIYYYKGDKHYFGLAMENDLGGYEVANKYAKICIGNKSITSISSQSDKISIFEGMFDFLACLTYLEMQGKHLLTDYLILHSVSMLPQALEKLQKSSYTKIYAFLDNDDAGQEATKTLKAKLAISDCSHFYKDCQDFNDFLLKVI
jgi:hypothetical protein